MRELVRRDMEGGALGIGSSLIYAPGYVCEYRRVNRDVQGGPGYKGKYISHMRDENEGLIEALEELLRISREAGIPAEIYHLKAAGEANWGKLDRVIHMVEKARAGGLENHGGSVHLPRWRYRA